MCSRFIDEGDCLGLESLSRKTKLFCGNRKEKAVTQEKHFRHELKFAIPYSEYLALRGRLRAIMTPDPHVSDDGTYRIRSIYFDNSDDKALREKEDGIQKREKFRIRYYNDDFSFITLEKKMKIDNLCLKYDAPISEEECRRILSGDTGFMKDHPEELCRELYAKMIYQRLRPRVLVSYLREPYIYRAGNVRVTFDSEVRTTLFSREFLTEKVSDISATDTPRDMLLEVKYDAFLPEIIRDIIQIPGLRQQAFSKYGACRRYG
ncbi:MAG: polyphosphate polymerase domain-containing protein [Lachnospiraceae bacterium]|nr:polyphosphate polymerase domain-containing protein [Lachnospiraceae bacterium]